jgi:hypothetical protein
MSENNTQTVTLQSPIDGHEKIVINRPTALQLLDAYMPDLLAGNGHELIKLVKKCGEFEDGTPVPSDLELKLDMLDIAPLSGCIMYFLRGLDSAKRTSQQTSKESSAKSSTSSTNTRPALKKSASPSLSSGAI